MSTRVALELEGSTLGECLAHAVEGFADAFTQVHPSVIPIRHPVVLVAGTPSRLLLAVLEECLRRGSCGQVAVGLTGARVDGDCLRGELQVVPVDDPHVTGAPPSLLRWHEVGVEQRDDGTWRGVVAAR